MRILVADDHPLYRDAVRAQLERLFESVDISEVSSLEEVCAVTDAPGAAFDLFLLDFHMPGMSPEALTRLIQKHPQTPVALISGTADGREICAAIQAGVRGFIPKTAPSAQFARGIELLLAGGTFVPTDILLGMTNDGPSSDGTGLSQPMNGLETLTTRELEVLKGVARGRSNKEIAREMNLAEVTVKLHLRSIFRKIGVRNRSEAAVAATRSGVG